MISLRWRQVIRALARQPFSSTGSLVLHVGGHILHGVRDEAGLLVHLPEGGLHKAVLIDLGVRGQVVDEADVGTFGGLDGAHPAVMAVVHVPDVEGGPLPAQAAGAQGGDAALVGQLGQGIVLVHELGQGRRAEELPDDRSDRPDVDEALGRDGVQVLDGHPLPNHPLQPGKAHPELILKQLAYAAQAAVAQMVDVVGDADAGGHAAQIVDGGQNVVGDDMLGDQVVPPQGDGLGPAVLGHGVQHFPQDGEANLLVNSVRLGIEGDELGHIHHAVGEDLQSPAALQGQKGLIDAPGGELLGPGPGERLAGHGQNFAGHGVGHRLGQSLTGQAGPDIHLLIEFVPAHLGHVVAPGIEEQRVHIRLGVFHCGGLAGTQAAVDLQEAFLPGLADVLFYGGADEGIVAEQLPDFVVGVHPQGPDQAGDGQLPVFIDADVKHALVVGFIFQPGAPVGDDGGGIGVLVRLVHLVAVVHAGRADDLGDDDTLAAVDDEGAAVCHNGEIPHENFLLLDLVGLGVAQTDPDLNGPGVSGVPLHALLHGVLGGVLHGKIQERQLQLSAEVRDCAHVPEDLLQALVQEPLIGVLLDLQKIWHFQDFLIFGIAFPHGLTKQLILDHRHLRHHSLSLGKCRNDVC